MCDCECNKTCKIDEYLDIKNFSCVKRLVGQSVLECEDEILSITEAFGKKITCKKSNCFIHTILFVIICLLLLVICVSCCFYYTKYRLKHLLPFTTPTLN